MPPEPAHLPPPSYSSKVGVDIAELGDILTDPKVCEDFHEIRITTRKAITVNNFKQMFYSSGDGRFSIANVYPCNDWRWIFYSVWGVSVNSKCPLSTPVYNFNRLGGRENSPKYVFSPYVYENDPGRTFLAQVDIMSKMENDICESRKNWTMCSRSKIFDSLYNLSLSPENSSSPCLKLKCGRTWEEVQDALFEKAECSDIVLENGHIVDFFINLRLDNCNECIKPVIIRIRYRVQITNITTDFYNSNLGYVYSTTPYLPPPNFYVASDWIKTDPNVIRAFGGGPNLIHSIVQNISGASKSEYVGEPSGVTPSSTSSAIFKIIVDSAGSITSLTVDPDNRGSGYRAGTIITFKKEKFKDSTNDLILRLTEQNINRDGEIIDNVLTTKQEAAIDAENAAGNPLQTGVVGDAPEGGKHQVEGASVISQKV